MECRLPSWNRLASDGRRRTHRIFARHLPRLAPCPLALPTLQRNWLAAQRWHIHLPGLLHPLARQQRHYLPTPALCCKKHDSLASHLVIAIILPIPKKTLLIITSAPAGRAAPQQIAPNHKKLRISHAKPIASKHLPHAWEVFLV